MNERLKDSLQLLASLPFTAFTTGARKEIGQRDDWTCQGLEGTCFWERVNGKPATFKGGYMVTAAHYPEVHDQTGNGYHDENTDNGRILCTVDHALEELQRGNKRGAQKLLRMGVYTWERASQEGKQMYLNADKLELLLKQK